VQGRDVLSIALARAGRRLPARVQRQGKVLFAQAVLYLRKHPRWHDSLDGACDEQPPYARLMTHIEGSTCRSGRKDRLLHLLPPALAFNLLFVAVALSPFYGGRVTFLTATGLEKLHNNKSPAAECRRGVLVRALVLGRCPALAGPILAIWEGQGRVYR